MLVRLDCFQFQMLSQEQFPSPSSTSLTAFAPAPPVDAAIMYVSIHILSATGVQ